MYSARSKASRHALASATNKTRWFSSDRPEPPHIPTRHAENTHRYPSLPSPTIHRLILLRQGRHRHCEGPSPVHTSTHIWVGRGLNLRPVSCPAVSREALSSTMTDTSLPNVESVGGYTDTLDPDASTWTLSLCPRGMATSAPPAVILTILLPSVDATTLSLK